MKAWASNYKGFILESPAVWTTGMLFAVDMVTNLTDYAFHLFLGWSLTPSEFAVVQTINALLLILITAFAVLQPVVARFVATFNAQAKEENDEPQKPEDPSSWRTVLQDQFARQPATPHSRTIFQRYMRQGLLTGAVLFAVVWLIRTSLATWLNVPVGALIAASLMLLLVLIRPVTFGVLQGQQQFVAFGLSRTSYAVGRLLLAILLITILGGGAIAGVLAMPIGALLSFAVALAFLGREIWQPGAPVAHEDIASGWRLSLAAFIAYTAFMSLQNIDLIWANRLFTAPVAGIYASAVVLRRVLVVLPGAILVILYPRLVAEVTRHQLPDRLLLKASVAIVGVTTFLTGFYFLFAPWLVDLMFGEQYVGAASLLGWMGVAMIAYALAAVWLNLFLATRPWPFVAVLATITGLQLLLLSRFNQNAEQLTAVFLLTGWLVALSGLLLYRYWLRPQMQIANSNYWNKRSAMRNLQTEFE
jgi:O-antigen/teichoic acid export membrane protein